MCQKSVLRYLKAACRSVNSLCILALHPTKDRYAEQFRASICRLKRLRELAAARCTTVRRVCPRIRICVELRETSILLNTGLEQPLLHCCGFNWVRRFDTDGGKEKKQCQMGVA